MKISAAIWGGCAVILTVAACASRKPPSGENYYVQATQEYSAFLPAGDRRLSEADRRIPVQPLRRGGRTQHRPLLLQDAQLRRGDRIIHRFPADASNQQAGRPRVVLSRNVAFRPDRAAGSGSNADRAGVGAIHEHRTALPGE